MSEGRPAAVLVSHGDRGGAAPNATLTALLPSLRGLLPGWMLEAGMLKGDPSLEQALDRVVERGARRIFVYPLFMADGYFTDRVLPARIGEAGPLLGTRPSGPVEILTLPPLGLDIGLPRLVHGQALAAARVAGLDTGTTRLLIASHGSRVGPKPALRAREVAAGVATLGGFHVVETAFLEEPPLLGDALAGSELATVVAGLFYGDGLHAGEDVPKTIRELGSTALYCGAIGRSAGVPALIAASLERALSA